MLNEIITKFLSACEGDSILQDFGKKRPLTVQFEIPDQNLVFYISFVDGMVQTGFGQASPPAHMTLKMEEAIFDGVMSGKINGASAAMSGKLHYRGDTMRGMALQKIINDIIRLYKKSKE